jgi:hypothetical protein
MQTVNTSQPKNNTSAAPDVSCDDDLLVVMNRDNLQALLSRQDITLTGNDTANADEVRAEMQNARSWLAKSAT